MPRLSEEKYQQIISDYLSGLTQKEVGIKNGVGRDAVGNILRDRNIPIREYTGERKSNQKWFWDKDFFDRRDPVTAYWAGFMMADGSLTFAGKDSYTLVLLVANEDKEHLEKFCGAVNLPLDAMYHVYDRGREYWRVHLNYYGLGDQMPYWGIVPRKTYNFVEPQVSVELLPHYLRGWADGDGSIYATGEGARFTVSGNTIALHWYLDTLRMLGYSGGAQFQPRNENYSVLYIGGANQTQEIANLLFANFPEFVKLDRKWSSHKNAGYKLLDAVCETCGKTFGVKKYRYNDQNNGRFCSKQCFYASIRRKVVDGKCQCAMCGSWDRYDDMAANKSYCKSCWNAKQREAKKRQKLRGK